MITILHGDDTVASRDELARLTANTKDGEVRKLEGAGLSADALIQALESHSLFRERVLVVIEHLFSSLGRSRKGNNEMIQRILRSGQDNDIILWEDKILTAASLKLFVKAHVVTFKLPAVIFELLDTLRPSNAAQLLTLLKQVLVNQPAEVVYALLLRRVRELLQIHDHVTPERLAPWQLTRLTRQARSFTMDKLVSMHRELVDMDIAIKSGSSPFSLAQQLEQYIIAV